MNKKKVMDIAFWLIGICFAIAWLLIVIFELNNLLIAVAGAGGIMLAFLYQWLTKKIGLELDNLKNLVGGSYFIKLQQIRKERRRRYIVRFMVIVLLGFSVVSSVFLLD